jgi:hypothetical protein
MPQVPYDIPFNDPQARCVPVRPAFAVGDAVVMVKVPDSVRRTAPVLRDGPAGILRVYQRAVAKASRLRVSFIDDSGRPWAAYSFRNKSRMIEHHAMLIDDDSYVLAPDKRNAASCG